MCRGEVRDERNDVCSSDHRHPSEAVEWTRHANFFINGRFPNENIPHMEHAHSMRVAFRNYYEHAMTQSHDILHSHSDFGAKLRSARKIRGLTQVQAATMAGVGVRLWNEVERGKRAQVGLETALRMLRTVGVELRLGEPMDPRSVTAPTWALDGPRETPQRPRMP